MSVFKEKNTIASVEFKKFKGIDRRAPHGDSNVAYDMSNFRILSDGSLQKREGYKLIPTSFSAIRGVWSGKLNGNTFTVAVQGATIIKLSPEDSSYTAIGNITNSIGTANFIPYRDRLYLQTEKNVFLITEDSITAVDGYAPLYGKNWPCETVGEVNEPLNLLSNHIRMSYVVDKQSTFLYLAHTATSIEAVYINGKLITDTTRYKLSSSLKFVNISGLNVGDKVTLFVTLDESELNKEALLSCKNSCVYGDYKDSILFFWNGKQKNVMFASCSVDKSALEEVNSVYPSAMPFYISEKAIFKLPKDESHITAVCRQYDRLLIFTKDETWSATLSASPTRVLEAITVNSSYGCTAPGAAVMCGNDPICVSDGTILRFTAETDELNECNAYSISSGIDELLSPSFFSNAIMAIDKKHSEIFFRDPKDDKNEVWIYNYATDNWYRFDGIDADLLFIHEGTFGFISHTAVYILDKTQTQDSLKGGKVQAIEAFYETHPTDFSVKGNKKRLCGMTLGATLFGGELTVEHLSDGEVISSRTFRTDSTFPTSFVKRLASRRFFYAKMRLSSNSNAHHSIHCASIWAKP